jgi:hypothetical protein
MQAQVQTWQHWTGPRQSFWPAHEGGLQELLRRRQREQQRLSLWLLRAARRLPEQQHAWSQIALATSRRERQWAEPRMEQARSVRRKRVKWQVGTGRS